jgi:hypothetical protein
MKYIIPTLFILILGLVLIASILEKKSSNKIGEGDAVKKCVIDTMYVTESPSTIEYGKRYNYKTSCDEVILTKRNNIYEIGDTLTFIYKKR